jgi:hypothetical protein
MFWNIQQMHERTEGNSVADAERVSSCDCGAAAKYTCPCCGNRTCSVACVKKHKETTSCTGKRDRTAFVDITSFDDSDMFSGVFTTFVATFCVPFN